MLEHNERWLATRLEELGKDLGRLRRGTRDTPYEWETDRLADRVWWLICRGTPTAGDLVNGGYDVPTALAIADQETRRLKTLLGEPLTYQGQFRASAFPTSNDVKKSEVR